MTDENSIVDSNGFIIYGTITGSYGAKVTVKESSNAEAPHVWILIEEGSLDNNNAAARLNVEQACAVRDALTTFIDQIPDRWDLREEE